jgi:hypothetical protein
MAAAKGTTARAKNARAEVASPTKTLTFKGVKYTLPSSAPFNLVKYDTNDVSGILTELLGEDGVQVVWDANLTLDEGVEFVQKILEGYGLTLGK